MEREEVKLALEAYLCREMPAGTIIGDPKWWVPKIAAAIKEALAQPAQEPVAWVWKDMRGQDIVSLFEPRFNSVPLYTASPQREWVGLTDDEIDYQAKKDDHGAYFALGALWAGAKLKERNS